MDSWEGLDIDESDVLSFIRKCNSNTEFIPGPAGNAQALMINRESEEPENTQQLMREIAAVGDARDFNSNAWKWARKFVEYHGKQPPHYKESYVKYIIMFKHNITIMHAFRFSC